MTAPSVIVYDFDAVRPAFGPDEAHTPAIVDANAELSRPIAFQGLKPIARRRAQGIERWRSVQHVELSRDYFRNDAPLRRACAVREKPFGRGIRKANDHKDTIYATYRAVSSRPALFRSRFTPAPVPSPHRGHSQRR